MAKIARVTLVFDDGTAESFDGEIVRAVFVEEIGKRTSPKIDMQVMEKVEEAFVAELLASLRAGPKKGAN